MITQVSGDTKADLGELVDMVGKGTLRAVVAETLPLARAADAYARVESRHLAGGMVLQVKSPKTVFGAA